MIDKLNNDFSLRNSGFSNYENTTDLPRHRWYYYKEGFSPKFVEHAIEQSGVQKTDLIIDPFNGSGTTTLTSALLGYQSTGIEVNPFTSFLAIAKGKNADPLKLRNLLTKLIEACLKGEKSQLVGYSTFSYRNGLEKWLFNRNVLNSFEGGWKYVNGIEDSSIKKILQLSLIVSIMDNCNAVKDGKCLRYRPTWKSLKWSKETLVQSITEKIKTIECDILTHPILTEPTIIEGDVRRILDIKHSFSDFKLCITSPPYLNTFDYTDIYRPELFLGKFVKDSTELYNLRLRTVRSHIQAKWALPKKSDFGILYDQIHKHVSENKHLLMHKDIPIMIQAYFEDMYTILKKLLTKAAPCAQIWLVVSNSAYADQEIPVDLIIGDVGSKAGWHLKEIGVLRHVQKRKTRFSPNVLELRESVIIFQRPK